MSYFLNIGFLKHLWRKLHLSVFLIENINIWIGVITGQGYAADLDNSHLPQDFN